MTAYVALLRAVNVGGTGKLAMSDLRGLCEDAGFETVATYIQSGNVVFVTKLSESKVKAKLEQALAVRMGKPVGVLVRTAAELEMTIAANPFAKVPPNRLLIFFLDEAPKKSAVAALVIPGREEIKLVGREVFIHYPDGQGSSKLKLPFAKTGTGRNLNTVTRLASMARELDGA